jgi:hypothetical protein
MADLIEQWEALTDEQRRDVARSMTGAMQVAGQKMTRLVNAMSAASLPLAQNLAAIGAALSDAPADQAPGVTWSQLMADIDRLTDEPDRG